MKILAFDSSNKALTVAVIEDDILLTEQIINIKRNHSLQLMPAIDEALKQAEVSLEELDCIAVAEGPGSYTGLRIAITVAKSLAWSKEIDLVGVSSLKVLAANSMAKNKKMIVPLFDARRENIYTGLYQWNESEELETIEKDSHIAAKQWASFLSEEYPNYMIELLGSDAKKFYPVFKEELGDNVQLAAINQHLPRASSLAFLARNEEPVETHHFIPSYLKLAEAEEDWLKEHPDSEGDKFVEKI
ncbi:MAG: tRNA (adenosine(37)-N6)-threonylcarbamoyltransferase complex dimerization subunit type 1 TsaB [Atopostipes sp.]|nr:tRNA (adenosine(37)-N6)-threonylcarbamoyltransferase complex dimerization subunit type 1 TsaB [Atopostipes sp.]